MEDNKQLDRYNRFWKESDDLYRSLAKVFGMSECSLWIIYFIRAVDESLTQRDLCGRMLQSKQSVNTALKKLVDEGYVSLKFAQNSKKSKVVALTAEGVDLAEKTVDKILKAEKAAFNSMSKEEVEQFLALSEKYLSCLKTEMEQLHK